MLTAKTVLKAFRKHSRETAKHVSVACRKTDKSHSCISLFVCARKREKKYNSSFKLFLSSLYNFNQIINNFNDNLLTFINVLSHHTLTKILLFFEGKNNISYSIIYYILFFSRECSKFAKIAPFLYLIL